MRTTKLAIVGGGPAGMSAAVEAAQLGVPSIVIDENPQLGGQIFRQLPTDFKAVDAGKLGKYYRYGKKILAEVAEIKESVEVWTDALVWGCFNDRELAVMRDGRFEMLKADQVIIAAGAYDRPIPFPGWTLPGVFTAGCAQVMVKSQRVIPGQKFLLAGSGPLQLALAHELLKAGAEVVAVVEAVSMIGLWRYIPRLLKGPHLMWDGMKYFATLKLHHVPFIQSHVITRAVGHDEVEKAVVTAVDKNWQPIPGTEQTFDVDAVCVGYGLIPNIDLPRECGCAHEYDPILGGWIPRKDENMETTVPGIYVAGDGCGINGVDVAVEQGKLAGIYASLNLGRLDRTAADKLAKPIRKKLKRLKTFQSAVSEFYSVQSGIYSLPDDDTIICRCEEVSLGEIRKAIRAAGHFHPNDVKRRTRAGMGYCQGRLCSPAIYGIAEAEPGFKPRNISDTIGRPPVKPIRMSLLLEESS
jgi:thioredoxin reductase